LSTRSDLEPLLVSTLRAAQDSGDLRKLVALARSLAAGVNATDQRDISVEHLLVLALHDLEEPHTQVLGLFVHGVISARGLKQPASVLNTKQILKVFGGMDLAMPAILATLVRHGLVNDLGGIADATRHRRVTNYEITPLGRRVVERLEDVGEVMA